MKKILMVTALGCLLMAAPASAKDGFYLGAGLVHDQMLSSDLRSLNPAVGLDLRIGYNFGPVALEGSLLGSTHDDTNPGFGEAKFGGLSIDFRIPFTPTDQPNRFYVLSGLAAYSLKKQDPLVGEVKYSGGGFNLGTGVEHYFNEHLAFNLAAVYRSIKYDKRETQGTTVTLSPKINGDAFSVEAGLNYYF